MIGMIFFRQEVIIHMFALEYIVQFENLKNIVISVTIFLLFILFSKFFAKYVFVVFLKITRKAPSQLFTQVGLAFEKPFRWLFIIVGIYVSVKYFPFIDRTNPLFLHLIRSSVILLIGWGLFNLVGASSLLILKVNDKFNINIDEIIIPFLSKALRLIIVAISIAVIADEFGYNVNGFVAGLGLGGLAFALAAKDVLANLFGGVIIITEKPFTIGDWILTPSVEGTVEDITFRSTKVRTFAQAVVTVPNATLADQPITNWSQMGKRRITFTLRVTHDTPKEKLENVVKRINHLLENDPDIHQETIFVTFDEYKADGLDIYLYFFTKTTVWGEYLKIKEKINFAILDILEEEGVSFALPSRRLYVDAESDDDLFVKQQS